MGNWDKIPGQKKLKDYFTRAVERGQISHAYILEGEPGTPKRELAEEFARTIQCEKKTGCGTCHSCLAFDSGNHPDVIRITHEKPDNIAVREIREQLVEDMGIRPYSSPYKIYLIDEAEKMNVQAQNALLKTLEEPPYYGVILLLTVNSDKFLPTILSRSIVLKCQNTDSGSTLLEPEVQEDILSVLRSAWDYDRTNMAAAAARWKKQEVPVGLMMNLVRIWVRDVLIFKELNDDSMLILKDEFRGIQDASKKYSMAVLEKILRAADVAERRIESNVNYELALEMFLTTMKVEKQLEIDEEDPWHDMAFPDFEEARFYSESYESTLPQGT